MGTPSETTASDQALDSVPPEVRRPRAILSCVACRDRKLKCDRGRPCNNCSRRHQTCRYYSSAQSGRNVPALASTATELSSRLRHLEDLLIILNNKQMQGTPERVAGEIPRGPAVAQDRVNPHSQGRPLETTSEPQRLEAVDRHIGSIFTNKEGTTYVEAGHWQSILDDIQDVRDFLQNGQAANIPPLPPFDHGHSHGPALLFGSLQSTSREDILAALPPRATVDRLVSRFFNSGESAIMVVHVPTFLKEYEEFWIDPNSVPMAWLGLLYSMLCMGVFFHARSGQPLPSPLHTGQDVIFEFQARAAQCLRQSDYTKTGKYKLEALLIYLGTEYFVSSDPQLGVSVCLSIIIHLAMHMGFHRDSDRFTDISLFAGEMRRRAWALITQVERLTSFQMGIPSIVDRSQCNTKLPHNYIDADIHQHMTSMPPERPESETTVLSYVIAKGRMITAFGNIVDAVCGNNSPSYNTITDLDIELEKSRTLLPSFLQMRAMSMSFTDSANLIMQRYNLELLYLKARCVLHRQYMTHATSNPRFAGSRAICVDAARHVLRHQADIHLEVQAGGQLHQDRWFVSSLTTSDFLLAAMILCLEVSRRIFERNDSTSDILAEQSSKEIIEQLEHSRQIWLDGIATSREAGRASEAIATMLHHVGKANCTPFTPETPGSAALENCRLADAIKNTGDEDGAKGFEEYLEQNDFDWQSWDMTMLQHEAGSAERTTAEMSAGSSVDMMSVSNEPEPEPGLQSEGPAARDELNWN